MMENIIPVQNKRREQLERDENRYTHIWWEENNTKMMGGEVFPYFEIYMMHYVDIVLLFIIIWDSFPIQ